MEAGITKFDIFQFYSIVVDVLIYLTDLIIIEGGGEQSFARSTLLDVCDSTPTSLRYK